MVGLYNTHTCPGEVTFWEKLTRKLHVMAELTSTVNLKVVLKPWGNYTGKTVLLYDNASFKDKRFLELCKQHQVRILPDLFTEIPDDKE